MTDDDDRDRAESLIHSAREIGYVVIAALLITFSIIVGRILS
jgi:hypothetical protein